MGIGLLRIGCLSWFRQTENKRYTRRPMSWYYPKASAVSGCISEWLMTRCTEDGKSPVINERNLCHGSLPEADLLDNMASSDAHSLTIVLSRLVYEMDQRVEAMIKTFSKTYSGNVDGSWVAPRTWQMAKKCSWSAIWSAGSSEVRISDSKSNTLQNEEWR